MIGRRSRRSFLKQAGALTLASALASCRNSSAPGKVVWLMSHEATRKRWAESTIIPGFRREHPEITVELLTVPWAEHDSTLLAMSAAGNTPDVFSQDGQVGAATFLQQKLLRPLDDMIDKYGWDLGNIPENSRRLWTFNGKLYGVPMFILGSFIFFNRDHFDQARIPYPPTDWDDPSWTWDEMVRR